MFCVDRVMSHQGRSYLFHNKELLLGEPPMDLDDFLWFGLVCHMSNGDFCNNFLKYLWCQLPNIHISTNW